MLIAVTASANDWRTEYDRALREGRFDDAATILAKNTTERPTLRRYHLAQLAWYQGDAEAALAKISAIRDVGTPEWVRAHLLQALIQEFIGDIDTANATSEQLRDRADTHPAVIALRVRLHLRRGETDKAHALVMAKDNNSTVLAARADYYDAVGDRAKANRVRLNALEAIESVSALRYDEQLEVARLCRLLHRYKDANTVLQNLQNLNPHDPFLQLEKIRLYRATHGYALAAQTAKNLAAIHAQCPQVYAEWAEIFFALKADSGAVQQLCDTALNQDATLLEPRNLLIHYALLGNDWARAENLLAENTRVNPAHRKTLGQRVALQVLQGNAERTGDRLALLELADIYAARGENLRALDALAPLISTESDDSAPLRRAAMAAFAAGRFDAAGAYAERALAFNAYDVHLFNLRALLKSVANGHALAKNGIEIINTDDEHLTSEYTAIVGSNLLANARKHFGVTSTESIRVVVCNDRNDLAVATAGIPFGCACDPSDPASSGVVSFDSATFLWSPAATGGKHPEYRFDQGLHRAILNAVVREATHGHVPQWLREGIAGAWMMDRGPEWAPTNLEFTVDRIAAGRAIPIAELESAVLSDGRPFALTYATLAVHHWRQTYGDAALLRLLSSLADGTDWREALQRTFSVELEDLDATTQDAIVRAYGDPATTESASLLANAFTPNAEKLDQAEALLANGAIEAAAALLDEINNTSARASLIAARVALAQNQSKRAAGLFTQARQRAELEGYCPTAAEFAAMTEAYIAVDDLESAAKTAAAALAAVPHDRSLLGVYRNLLTRLQASNDDTYYVLLEALSPIERNDAQLRLELAEWYADKDDPTRALRHATSAVGIRPAWIEAHRLAADLAQRAGDPETAYLSLAVLHAARPKHGGILRSLAEAAQQSGRAEEAAQLTEKLSELQATHQNPAEATR